MIEKWEEINIGYDRQVRVSFNYEDHQDKISFTLPLQYMWDNMSEDDLIEFAKIMIYSGKFKTVLLDALNSCEPDREVIELQELLISRLDELKEGYVENFRQQNNYIWWSIGRGLVKLLEEIYPDRKFNYSVNYDGKTFHITDLSQSDEPKNELVLDLFSMTCSIDKSPANTQEFERYIKKLAEEIHKCKSENKKYWDIVKEYYATCDELQKAKRRIQELEKRLETYEKTNPIREMFD